MSFIVILLFDNLGKMIHIFVILIFILVVLMVYIAYKNRILIQNHHQMMRRLNANRLHLNHKITFNREREVLVLGFESNRMAHLKNIQEEIVALQNVLLKSVTNQNNS